MFGNVLLTATMDSFDNYSVKALYSLIFINSFLLILFAELANNKMEVKFASN